MMINLVHWKASIQKQEKMHITNTEQQHVTSSQETERNPLNSVILCCKWLGHGYCLCQKKLSEDV